MTTDGQDSAGMGRRLAALVGAAALVLAAIVVRGALDDGDDEGRSDASAELTLVCPPDLAGACQAAADEDEDLTVVEQPTSETVDALLGVAESAGLEADVWLVPRPWAEAVGELADPGDLDPLAAHLENLEPVARTPVVVVAWEDRAEALEAGECGGSLTWLCLGDVAGRAWGDVGGEAGWGRVQAGLADAESSGGPAVWGTVAAAYLGDSSYHTNDIGSDLLRWFDGFAAAEDAATSSDPVRDMLTRGAGHLAVLGTTEVAATSAAGRDEVRIQALDRVATVDLVVVPLTGAAAEDAERVAGDAALTGTLAAAGWRVPGHDLAPGLDTELELPDEAGLPAGVVLHSLLGRLDH